ncbi:hypothetical protein, partial [Klebsiella pneumoniae]|uniref:hypothetical protein n=1 Tax=Klebsiella pneumoniae TaxID=573 RepID=UPI00211C35C6
KRAYCLKTQPATGETYPKSDLFNKAVVTLKIVLILHLNNEKKMTVSRYPTINAARMTLFTACNKEDIALRKE